MLAEFKNMVDAGMYAEWHMVNEKIYVVNVRHQVGEQISVFTVVSSTLLVCVDTCR